MELIAQKTELIANKEKFYLQPSTNPKDTITVEIGDTKQKEFYPQVKMMRWDNEVNFSVRLVHDEKEFGYWKQGDSVIWEGKDLYMMQYYGLEPNDKRDCKAQEMQITLKDKPKTNKIEFTIQSKGLDFFYQPPLTEEFKNGYSKEFQKEIIVSDTQVKDLEGNVLVERPENVVGSYAVYHSTKGGMNDTYGKDYKVGKAFHIFRPHLIDANGMEAWGNLHIENGIYSVEIPQDFLDKAVYPIKSNDWFGYQGDAATAYSIEGIIDGMLRAPTGAGTGVSISVRLICATTAHLAKASLYDGADPNSNIITNGATEELTIPIAGATWYTFNFVSAPTLDVTNYTILIWGQSTTGTLKDYYDTAISGYTNRYKIATYGSWPANIDWSVVTSIRTSIYATYTPSQANVTVYPSVLDTTSAILQPSVSTGTNVTYNASVLDTTSAIETPTIVAQQNVTVSPSVLTGTSAILTPTVLAIKNITYSASVLTTTSALLTPTVLAIKNITLTPDVLNTQSSIENPSVSTAGNVSYGASVMDLVSAVLQPTVVAEASVEVSPDVLTLTSALLTPSVGTGANTYISYDSDSNSLKVYVEGHLSQEFT